MIEYFDVVDERDRPTGVLTTRNDAHERGLRHRIAAILVFTAEGKLLVQAHKYLERKMDHSAGGHVGTGEDYVIAAAREVFEELGLKTALEYIATVVPPLAHYEVFDPAIRHTFGVFATTAPRDWEFVPNEEVDLLQEMGVEEIVSLMNTTPDRFLWGFMASLGAYLRVTKSPFKIMAYGRDWSNL